MELILKKVGDISGVFFVPQYQRGYRWTKTEVNQLLNDIWQNINDSYCLQPIVVKNHGNRYELIDGQQRLTTLYLIYHYLCSKNPFFGEPLFSLVYETREKSEGFLKNIDESLADDNIDFHYIANAYKTICQWFEFDDDIQIRAINIFKYLKEKVSVIWYETAEEDGTALFTRLNIGKIPLTSAEIVKSMFLSSSYGVERTRQEELALQWDNIERELHDESLWHFLTNGKAERYQTRIDLVLDLIAKKPSNSRENFFTFFYFDELRKTTPLPEIWSEIQRTFLTLKDWYEDHELYHKIGYLIASEAQSLADIYAFSKGATKTDFKKSLDEKICESIGFKTDYADLNYENDYGKISTLLLLFNVEAVRKNGIDRFPFDKHKGAKWSLEHIHAQQSEGLSTKEAWKEWLQLHIPSVKAVAGANCDLVLKMKAASENEKLTQKKFEEIQKEAFAVLSPNESEGDIHSISNLALIDKGANSALSNSTFDVKRNEIIKMDKAGRYIPFCTRNVFLKYYTPSEQNQIHFWSKDDRAAYIAAMNEVLKPYLKEQIVIEN